MVCVQRRVSRELLPLRFCSHVIYYLIEFITVVFYVSQLLCLAFAKASNKERFKSPSNKSAKMSWTCFFNAEGEAPALCARSGGDHTASHCKHRPSKTSWRHTAVAGMCVCVCVKVIMALFLTAELTQLVCNKAQSGLKHNRTRRTGC